MSIRYKDDSIWVCMYALEEPTFFVVPTASCIYLQVYLYYCSYFCCVCSYERLWVQSTWSSHTFCRATKVYLISLYLLSAAHTCSLWCVCISDFIGHGDGTYTCDVLCLLVSAAALSLHPCLVYTCKKRKTMTSILVCTSKKKTHSMSSWTALIDGMVSLHLWVVFCSVHILTRVSVHCPSVIQGKTVSFFLMIITTHYAPIDLVHQHGDTHRRLKVLHIYHSNFLSM